ncbi:TniQ family protein [Agrobacterium sp. V1]|uniref:TniQ family protein n=1 Tax=Agrobacterium sp. V1 TaxID=3061957 RepID=UPI002671A58F|nr:TniQ family protein [Agrobacterium sp. V1]MDO3441837.1 TniQ family protein [Agrobacterium sp. V1]
MAKLSLTLPIQPSETLPSYCSRIAAVNGIGSASEFSSHFGFSFDRLAKGWHADMEVFADLVGKRPDQLHLSQLAQFRKTVETYGGVFTREFIDTDRCRICPACVLNDIGPKYAFHRAYGRAEWMLKFVHTCPDHGIPLIRLASDRRIASDFATQLRAIIRTIEFHANEPLSNSPTGLQNYVINRVRGGKLQGIWLDGFAIQAAAHFTELLGAVIRDGSEPDLESYNSDDWMEVADIGFGIVEKGSRTVKAVLRKFIAPKPISHRIRASMFFGRLSWELLDRFDQPGYLDLTKFLESVVCERYPKLVSDLPA